MYCKSILNPKTLTCTMERFQISVSFMSIKDKKKIIESNSVSEDACSHTPVQTQTKHSPSFFGLLKLSGINVKKIYLLMQ